MSSALLESLYDQLTCSICFEPYNLADRRPHILSCGHTFGLDCLSSLLLRSTNNKLECPFCKQQTAPPQTGDAASVPKNFFLCELIGQLPQKVMLKQPVLSNALPSPTKPVPSIANCTSCASRKKVKLSTHSCSACKSVFCDAHAPAHQEDEDGHLVRPHSAATPAADSNPAASAANPLRRVGLQCVLHDKEFEYYCNSCHVPVCVSCIVHTHSRSSDHSLIELNNGRETSFANVAALLPAAATTGKILSDNLTRHNQARSDALSALQRTQTAITAHFNALIAALQARAEQLRNQTAESVNQYVKELGVKADEIEMHQSLLHSCAAFARQEVERESGKPGQTKSTPGTATASSMLMTRTGRAATHAERILLLNKIKNDLVQKLANASEPSLSVWPHPLYCKFGTGDDVVRSANELLTSAALGMLVASPINLNNALIECPLLQKRPASRLVRVGELVELQLQLCDNRRNPIPQSGWKFSGRLRAVHEAMVHIPSSPTPAGKNSALQSPSSAALSANPLFASPAASTPMSPANATPQPIEPEPEVEYDTADVVIRDMGNGQYAALFRPANVGTWILELSAQGQMLSAIEFTVPRPSVPGSFLRSIGHSASSVARAAGTVSATSFDHPWGLAFNSEQSVLYVCDRGHSRVVAFKVRRHTDDEVEHEADKSRLLSERSNQVELSVLWQYGGMTGGKHGLLHMPRGCSLSDDQETLAVVDAENNRLVLLRASDGALLQTFGAEEAGAGQLNLPSCVSMSQQKLWVSDASNHRVLCFDEGPNHHVLFQFGRSEEAGSDDHHFTIPSGVAVHGYKVFVADFRNHRVQVFDDVSGECIYTIGGEQGQLPGQLAGPEGIAIDHGRDLLYVCEGINRRVSVFNASTFAYVGRITTPSNTQRPAEFQYPIAVTVDAGSAEVYVSDFAHARVHVFSAF